MPAHLHTINLYKFDDVVSALQKSIRRCDTAQALFWAGELNQGFKPILYSRLWTIIAEDIGLASPFLAQELFPLYQAWTKAQNTNTALTEELTIRIVYTLSKAPKNRVVDNLLLYNYFQPRPTNGWKRSTVTKRWQEKIQHLFSVNLFEQAVEKEIDVQAALVQLVACLEKRDATNAYYFCNIINLSTEETDRLPWLLQYLGLNKPLKIDSKWSKKMTLFCWYILFEMVKDKKELLDVLKVLFQLYLGKIGAPNLLLAFAILLYCNEKRLVQETTRLPLISEIPSDLQNLYYNNQATILERRQLSIPDYAIDKHTDRGKPSAYAPHNIADLHTEAQKKRIATYQWSPKEIAKSHGNYKVFADYVQSGQHSRMSHFFQEGALLKNTPTNWKGEDPYKKEVERYFLSLEKKYNYQACSGFFILEKMRPIWIQQQELWK
ncbi:hypothetical protein [Aureispira sp. CCB-E]|uniref:hypothetical protein n=1 Tax=Aureispira sp. CCB-E TaxID=3051121 RepID=UPI00286895FC|nr:hypothetical protein [Aureispira sp. CCB-E]WMX13878.1 hypothetical protein QP953_23785 [Aureispira sp. CCB-E]